MRTILKTSSALQINAALKSDPDRARRVAARLHDSLRPVTRRTFEAMEIYKRLHGVKEPKP